MQFLLKKQFSYDLLSTLIY